MEELYAMADDLRAMMTRMNAYEGHESATVQSRAYRKVDDALSVLLGILTKGEGDDRLNEVLLDCPEYSTEGCIERWRDFYGIFTPVTVLDYVRYKVGEKDTYNMDDHLKVGVSMFPGCGPCGARLGSANAYPSQSGYIRCADCIGDDGFRTVEAFEEYLAG